MNERLIRMIQRNQIDGGIVPYCDATHNQISGLALLFDRFDFRVYQHCLHLPAFCHGESVVTGTVRNDERKTASNIYSCI